MNQQKIEKELRFLKIYAAAATLIALVMMLTAFSVSKNAKFDEIDVKRINVKDDDGKLRMVIANKDRQHPGMIDGKLLDRKRNSAGMLFFDEQANEIGGLIFETLKTGEDYKSFTFDRTRGDQTIALQHLQNKEGQYWAGLVFADDNIDVLTKNARIEEIKKLPDADARKAAYQEMRDKGELTVVPRLALGRGRDKSPVLTMSDAKGKPRINMSVAANGTPKLDFLDENGKVFYSLPEDAKAKK